MEYGQHLTPASPAAVSGGFFATAKKVTLTAVRVQAIVRAFFAYTLIAPGVPEQAL